MRPRQLAAWVAVLAHVLGLTKHCAAEHDVEGKLVWDEHFTKAAKIKLIMTIDGAPYQYAWPRPDGKFAFHNIPAGSHLLDVSAPGLLYPQMRVDVANNGRFSAMYADDSMRILGQPLIIRPEGKAEYFEAKTAFNVIAFVKSPMGLMIAFGVFALVVLPYMKIDADEYKELMGNNTAANPPATAPAPVQLQGQRLPAPRQRGTSAGPQRRRERRE